MTIPPDNNPHQIPPERQITDRDAPPWTALAIGAALFLAVSIALFGGFGGSDTANEKSVSQQQAPDGQPSNQSSKTETPSTTGQAPQQPPAKAQ